MCTVHIILDYMNSNCTNHTFSMCYIITMKEYVLRPVGPHRCFSAVPVDHSVY